MSEMSEYVKKSDVLIICKNLYEGCTYYLRRKYINAINSINYGSKPLTSEKDGINKKIKNFI